jgi:hypothetical protein
VSFSCRNNGPLAFWTGDPDCQAGHDYLLIWLRKIVSSFLLREADFNRIIQGNLGESISFHIGYENEYAQCYPFPSNALTPLARISKPEIDIVWLNFGEQPADDFAILQEVKTTTDSALSVADRLLDDYNKLYGTNPAFTLHTRLQAIKNDLEYRQKRPALCQRVLDLAGQSPKTSPRIKIIPTLVHDLAHTNVTRKLLAVRETLCSNGWTPSLVNPWSIAMSDLDNRLRRLVMGRN